MFINQNQKNFYQSNQNAYHSSVTTYDFYLLFGTLLIFWINTFFLILVKTNSLTKYFDKRYARKTMSKTLPILNLMFLVLSVLMVRGDVFRGSSYIDHVIVYMLYIITGALLVLNCYICYIRSPAIALIPK